jgi:uncharacterized protein (DUF488 family)
MRTTDARCPGEREVARAPVPPACSVTSKRTTFSVGHSTHELGQLVGLLHAHRVEQLADVRAHPGSRRSPWFDRDVLSRELPAHGLRYVHLPALGGRRRPVPDSPNGGWRVEAFRGYADYMATAEWRHGIAALEALACQAPTAMMCAEGLWWRCHRRLIADALTVSGWEVIHIAPDGATAVHEPTPFAVAEGGALTYPPAQARLDLD